MSRQEKVIDTERLLKEIQRELTREDGKFQEAYKLAVGAAKKKEVFLLINAISLTYHNDHTFFNVCSYLSLGGAPCCHE